MRTQLSENKNNNYYFEKGVYFLGSFFFFMKKVAKKFGSLRKKSYICKRNNFLNI